MQNQLTRPQKAEAYLALIGAFGPESEPFANAICFETIDSSIGLTFTLHEGIAFAVETSGKERLTLDVSEILGYGAQAVTRAMAMAGFFPVGDGETFTNSPDAANTHRIKLPHDLISRWYE